jgi:hypothetical protein
MAKLRILTDEEFIKSLATKYAEAKKKHDKLKVEFEIAEMAYQCINDKVKGGLDAGSATQVLFTASNEENQMPMIEGLDTVKAVLFLHSKLCISDPIVTGNPRKQDPATKSAARYAEGFIKYSKDHTCLQETIESGAYVNLCIYGNGITFTGWDPNGGDFPVDEIPDDADPNNLEIKMEGDYDFRNVSPKRFLPDANATDPGKMDHCFEETDAPKEEAFYKFSSEEQQDILRQAIQGGDDQSALDRETKSTVKLYHYWERGRPWNGFLGCHAIFTNPDNPRLLYRGANPFKHKRLPYSILTDIDIPDNVMGMSRIIYAYQVQMCINNLITMVMNNASLFGTAKYLAPEGSLNDDQDNDPAVIGTFNPATNGKPEFFRPVNVTPDVWKGYDILKRYIDNVYGMNEFSQGQIPRELSSYAVQLALEMDDKYRIRLFNKKKLFLRNIYTTLLEVTKQYMTDSRRLSISGVEEFQDDEYFKASMLEGDYDISVEYGAYIPVDPAARKQQILEFIKSGFFEKAGGDMKKAASLLIDGSMLDVRDSVGQSRRRQQAEIKKIINGEKVNVQPWDKDDDHAAEIEDYCGTATFEALPPAIQQAVWDHGEAHIQALAEKIAKGGQGAPGAPGAPGGAPGGGAPGMGPMGPGMGAPPAMPKPGSEPPPPITSPAGPLV